MDVCMSTNENAQMKIPIKAADFSDSVQADHL